MPHICSLYVDKRRVEKKDDNSAVCVRVVTKLLWELVYPGVNPPPGRVFKDFRPSANKFDWAVFGQSFNSKQLLSDVLKGDEAAFDTINLALATLTTVEQLKTFLITNFGDADHDSASVLMNCLCMRNFIIITMHTRRSSFQKRR